MADAQVSKARRRPPRPEALEEHRAWARRINAILRERDLLGVEVPGDERVELRWQVTDARPAHGDIPAQPARGRWALLLRVGLQTARDFGTPRRPPAMTLGLGDTPQAAWKAAGKAIKLERLTHVGHNVYHKLRVHLDGTEARLAILMREERRAQRADQAIRTRRAERRAWHAARAQATPTPPTDIAHRATPLPLGPVGQDALTDEDDDLAA